MHLSSIIIFLEIMVFYMYYVSMLYNSDIYSNKKVDILMNFECKRNIADEKRAFCAKLKN